MIAPSRLRFGLGLVAATFFVNACSAGGPAPSFSDGPYASDFAVAFEGATSEFEKEALGDGVITWDEYRDAHELWLECMEGSFPPGGGVSVDLRLRGEDGLYEYVLRSESGAVNEETQREFDLLYDACSKGTIEWVSALYNSIQSNPENLPIDELLYNCILSGGGIPAGYAEEQFRDDLTLWNTNPDAIVHGPLSAPLSALVLACFANPRPPGV